MPALHTYASRRLPIALTSQRHLSLQVRFLGSFAKVLQTVPPAATALAAGMLLFDETAVPLTLSTAIFLEATHYITCAVGSRAFSSDEFRAQTLPEREDEEQLALWQQCLDETSSSSSVSTADFIRGWFIPSERASRPADGEELTVTLAELQRENVADWLAYALYAIAPSALDEEQADHVDAAIQMLEKRLTDERAPTRHNDFRFTFPAGHNSEVVAMRLNVDTPQTNMMQRPLFYCARILTYPPRALHPVHVPRFLSEFVTALDSRQTPSLTRSSAAWSRPTSCALAASSSIAPKPRDTSTSAGKAG